MNTLQDVITNFCKLVETPSGAVLSDALDSARKKGLKVSKKK